MPKERGEMTKKTKDYLRRAGDIHKNKYDYSLVQDIKTNKDRIDILCPIHGKFSQVVANHVCTRQGCPRCGGNYRKSTEEVMIEIDRVHGDKFVYPLFEYKTNKQKIEVICRTHGSFFPSVKEHLKGGGCPKCAKNAKMNTASFIEKAKKIHGDRYDYSLVDYKGTEELITIKCKKHGPFAQRPHGHMMGYGCAKCVGNSSKKENEWLDSFNIPSLKRQHRLKLGNSIRVVDGFDPSTNTVYEFYGDYFHGNDTYYDHGWTNKLNGKSFAELYQKTMKKEKLVKKAGYNLVTIWESEYIESKGKPFYKKPVPFYEKKIGVVSYINQWRAAYGQDDDGWGIDVPDPMSLLARCSKKV